MRTAWPWMVALLIGSAVPRWCGEIRTHHPPYQPKGTVILPTRAISKWLGAEAGLDSSSPAIAAERREKLASLTPEDRVASIDGKKKIMSTAAVLEHSRTFVPVRFVAQAFGAEVGRDASSGTVTIRPLDREGTLKRRALTTVSRKAGSKKGEVSINSKNPAKTVGGALGPSESAPATAWPSPNAVVSRPELCQAEGLARIAPLRIAGTHWGGAIYPEEVGTAKVGQIEQRIAAVHAAGARFIGSINGRGLYHRGMDSEAVRLLDGKPYTHPGMNNMVYKCSLSPAMYDAFLSTAQRCVDMGMDGFILDSWMGEGCLLCFCDHCLRFYRERLAARAGAPELSDLKGTDLAQFDYGQCLRGLGYTAQTPIHKLPMGQILAQDRFDELVARKRRFLGSARAYASQHAGKPFTITANVYSMPPMTFAVHDLLDYLSVELPYFGSFDGYPPMCSSIALHKKGRAAGKRCVIQPGCHDTARALLGRPRVSTLFKIWVAEAYASGNLFDLVPREFAGYEKGKEIFLDLPVADLLPYYRFVQDHPEIYGEGKSPAKVAVLYSMSAGAASAGPFEREYQAVCKLLYDSHYQFDVVLDGDGKWNQTLPDAAALSRYDTVVVLCPQSLREATVDRLLSYREKGGRLVLCGKQSWALPPYRRLCERVMGDYLPPQELPSYASYLGSRDAGIRETFTKAVGPDPVLFTNAPPEVGILCWQVRDQTIVHLINYAYLKETDTTKAATDIEIKLSVHASTGRLLSPDGDKGAQIKLQTDKEAVRFVVPNVEVYAVVVLSNKT